ncbi:MAG TPA: helix-turn-helix domain-containing protein [Patescibacteria group bacterium]|nr:helix-turn-helix domain-containing protein [Patescibacteria group bacterium]
MRMARATETESAWLSLEEAARRLDVHPPTLRDWADKGRIRTFRTPGGHRRFTEADVAALAAEPAPDLSLFMNATVGHARLAASGGRLAGESWYSRFDEAAKTRQRELGTDLVHALVAYLGDADRSWASEIKLLGTRYADLARDTGLSLGDAMRAFHLFEGLVRASVNQLTAARASGPADLEQNVGWFLNEVQVAMVESFSKVT